MSLRASVLELTHGPHFDTFHCPGELVQYRQWTGRLQHRPRMNIDGRRLSPTLPRLPILIKLGESLIVLEHFVLWKLEPCSGDRPKYPKYKSAESDCGYDFNNCVDHWPGASSCPLPYMLWMYFTSKCRSSSLRRLFHAGMELPGIPCSIAVQALSVEG
jgi:hypothetical protein